MAGAAKPTTDHQKIRQWVEDHGGHPAAVKQTGSDDDPGVLRIDFPGYSGEGSLEPISWDEFFEKRTGWRSCTAEEPGEESRFFKLVRRSAA